MNLIPEICKLLGVGVREEFKLKFDKNTVYDQTFRFDESGGLEYKDEYSWVQSCKTRAVLTGELEVVKIPFKPEYGMLYYYAWGTKPPDIRVACTTWFGCFADLERLHSGNCFCSEDEAEANKFKIYEKLSCESLEDKHE